MNLSTKTILAGAALLAALSAPITALAETRTMTGAVTFGQSVSLPPDTRVEVQLVDVSLADAPAQVLGQAVVVPTGHDRVPFRLDYDDDQLQANHSYALQARVTHGDDLLFINDTRHPVLTGGPDVTDVRVVPVAQTSSGSPYGSWLAEDIGGGGVIDNAQSVLVLGEDGTVTGSGGCNQMNGTMTFDGEKLSFGPIATTRRACVPALGDQEAKFLLALSATQSWRIDGEDKLILLDGAGNPALRLSRQ